MARIDRSDRTQADALTSGIRQTVSLPTARARLISDPHRAFACASRWIFRVSRPGVEIGCVAPAAARSRRGQRSTACAPPSVHANQIALRIPDVACKGRERDVERATFLPRPLLNKLSYRDSQQAWVLKRYAALDSRLYIAEAERDMSLVRARRKRENESFWKTESVFSGNKRVNTAFSELWMHKSI